MTPSSASELHASCLRPAQGLGAKGRPVGNGDLRGREISGYGVGGLLAEGGMGSVYAARHLATGTPAALKVLQWRYASDAGFVSRFEREIAHARRVVSPYVAPVLHEGRVFDGRPFFIMPRVGGTTLGRLVQASGPLSVERGLAVADGVLAALEAIHAQGIVHRDIQPDNVLVDGDSVTIIDFGLAHEEGVDTGDGVTPDSPGALVGTLTFLSPEQATRCRALTIRSDLFSAGLILYYALSGQLPFRGDGDLDVIVSILRSAPVPLRRARRDAPPLLDRILARALAKHPESRFASATEMRAALREVRPTR